MIEPLDELYLLAATNLMRDSIECARTPSGLALTDEVARHYENATARFEAMVRVSRTARTKGDSVLLPQSVQYFHE